VWVKPEEKEQLMQVVEPDEDDTLPLWREQNTPKVTVDRVANAGAIFHVGRLHFAPGCGLWLMARGEADWLNRTEAALRLLADSGLGGQRSRGNGQFTIDAITPPSLANVQATDHACLLSRLAPRVDEMGLLRKEDASYQLVTVGGFTGTAGEQPVVRRQVRMLTEGSIIGHSERTPGQLVNVTPGSISVGHSIYRYGYGFTVPAQIDKGGKAV
jgi:CRISPR-associated protein Csm4